MNEEAKTNPIRLADVAEQLNLTSLQVAATEYAKALRICNELVFSLERMGNSPEPVKPEAEERDRFGPAELEYDQLFSTAIDYLRQLQKQEFTELRDQLGSLFQHTLGFLRLRGSAETSEESELMENFVALEASVSILCWILLAV